MMCPVTGKLAGSLIGVGPLCDADCTVTFTSTAVLVRYPHGNPVLTGCREQSDPRLWRISLQPDENTLPSMPYGSNKTTLQAYSAYDLPSVSALIRYFHAAAGYTVQSTWLKSIGSGKYSTWPGFTLANATKYCPTSTQPSWANLVDRTPCLF